MTEQTPAADQTPSGWQRFVAALPTGLALLLIGLVWLAGAVWSFEEQTRYARANGFEIPQLLPLVLDGMAVAMAAVAWAASLDARPAVFARLGTAVAIGASSASNGAWAWSRSTGDVQTVVLAAVVPVLAMLAFEVLLAEVRRQVLRRRGQPGPVAVAYPRLVRVVLAPWSTLRDWRRLVLKVTDPRRSFPTDAPDEPVPAVPDPAPVAERTPVSTVPVQTPEPRQARTAKANRARRPAVRLVQTDKDEPDLAKLRDWRSENGTPSLKQIEALVGCGRSKAVRLRDRLAAEDADRAAV